MNLSKEVANEIMIKTLSKIILEDEEEIYRILCELEYQTIRHLDKISKISETLINLESKGFCMPEPPNMFKKNTIKERAKEAFEWKFCVKQRKEATIMAHKKRLPVAAIMNIVDFI
jgi:hypothetical protein|tara:strand:- start:95 stop:442 length:348 start_codon:yes stop_codon:yes gene_type:complete